MADTEQPEGRQEPTRLSEGDLAGETTRPEVPDDPGGAVESRRLGDFELLRELGRGGMGVVYEARQVSLKRRVALKVLPPALGMSPQAKQRFEREAQAAAKLHHTNIVPVHAIGEHDGYHYYAMDLIEGQSLDHVLREMVDAGANSLMEGTVTQTVTALAAERAGGAVREQVPSTSSDTSAGGRQWFDTVAKLVADVADALHYAHESQIIHRDIKPANLMLSREGRLCVTDFGLARVLEEPGITVTGSFLGTPAYMSPEQIAAGRMKVDHRTDIYSLGAVLYEMLTLEKPFPGQSREEILNGVLNREPRRLRRIDAAIPPDLETICLKALEKDPERRYRTAGELANDLRQYLRHGLISARRAGVFVRTKKWIRRHPLASTVAASAVLVIAVATTSVRTISSQRTREQVLRAVSEAERNLDAGLYRKGLEVAQRAVALDPEDPAIRILRARLLFQLNRTSEAADEAHALLARDPTDWAAHLILAAAGIGVGGSGALPQIPVEEHVKAVEEHAPDSAEAYYLRAHLERRAADKLLLLDRALELDPAHAETLRARIEVHYEELKDYEAALDDCERLIIARSRSSQGRRLKARVLMDRQDHQQALGELERAMQIDALDPLNFEARAQTYRAMGRWNESVQDFTRAIELDPTDALYYQGRADAYNEAGKFEKAVADARTAIDLQPDYRSAYRELADAYYRLDRGPELRDVLDQLRSRSESWPQDDARSWAYRTIAEYCRKLRDYECALDAADRAIGISPDSFHGYIVRARIHDTLSDAERVESDCDAAIEVEIDSPVDRSRRAWRLGFDCKRWDLARNEFTRVIEQVPTWHAAHYGRGVACALLGQNDDALADLNRALELAPNYRPAYQDRASVLENMGRKEEGMRDRRKLLELGPHHVTNWVGYGMMLGEQGRLEEALAALDRALELNPRHGFANATRGQILAHLGRCEEAIASLSLAEESDPASEQTRALIAAVHVFEMFWNCRELSDVDAALEHVRFAYPAQPRWRHVLAMTLFRKEDYAEACELGTGEWFRMMCAWYLGDRNTAREMFEEWVAAEEKKDSHHSNYRHQREEAMRVMGLGPYESTP